MDGADLYVEDGVNRHGVSGWLLPAAAAFFALLYCSYVYLYFYQQEFIAFKPLYWYVLTIGAAAAVFLVCRTPVDLSSSRPVLAWVSIYLLYTFGIFLSSSLSDTVSQLLVSRIEMMLLLLSFMVLLVQPGAWAVVQKSLVALLIAAVLINIYDFLVPTFSYSTGRAAGLYFNPTVSGRILTLIMVSVAGTMSPRRALILCAVTGIGVLLTFSRGAWIGWAAGIFFLSVFGVFGRRYRVIASSLMALSGALLLWMALTGGLLGVFEWLGVDDALNRNTLMRLGASGGAFDDQSTFQRSAAIRHAYETFAQAPWLGGGFGFTSEWDLVRRPHNMYALIAAEEGILGLVVFASLFVAMWRSSAEYTRAMIFTLAVTSLTTHNNLEQPAVIFLIAVVSVSAALERHKEQPAPA